MYIANDGLFIIASLCTCIYTTFGGGVQERGGRGPRKGREGPKKGGMRGKVLIKLQMINAVHRLFFIIIKESKITQPVEMDMKIIPEQHTH